MDKGRRTEGKPGARSAAESTGSRDAPAKNAPAKNAPSEEPAPRNAQTQKAQTRKAQPQKKATAKHAAKRTPGQANTPKKASKEPPAPVSNRTSVPFGADTPAFLLRSVKVA